MAMEVWPRCDGTSIKICRHLFDAVSVMHALSRLQSLLVRCGGATAPGVFSLGLNQSLAVTRT